MQRRSAPADGHVVEVLIGIVDALRHDYDAGGLLPVQERVRAEVFDDFLEMAEHLLEFLHRRPVAASHHLGQGVSDLREEVADGNLVVEMPAGGQEPVYYVLGED